MPSHRLRVLVLCGKNRQRSPAAVDIYRDDSRLEMRSAGVSPESRRRVTEGDLGWADLVLVMEKKHLSRLREAFPETEPAEAHVLDIPDEFERNDPALREMLNWSIDPILEARLTTVKAEE